MPHLRNQPPASAASNIALADDITSGTLLKRPTHVRIAEKTLPVYPTLDTLFIWMAERDRIRKRRLAGDPPPWTNDLVLKQHKFCNVFRIYDRGTQHVLYNVVNKGSQDHVEVCFRVILFKLFNRISTWHLLEKNLGPLSWNTFNLEAYEQVLAAAARLSPLYTGAYQIHAPKIVQGASGLKNHLLLLQTMMDEDLPGQLLRCEHMQDAYELIKLYPSMGEFLSYQLLLDLNMTPNLNYPENEWAVCGPGSFACLQKIFGSGVRGVESDAIAYLYKTQDEHFARLGITDPPSMYTTFSGVSFVDIEHSLCECSKYCKWQGVEGIWQPKMEPTTSQLPVKWQHTAPAAPTTATSSISNNRFSSPSSEVSDEDSYEVSHIVEERLDEESGDRKYRVRWVGYSPNADTWFSETDLKNASDILRKWNDRRLIQEAINHRLAKINHEHVKDTGTSPNKPKLKRSTRYK